MFKDHIANDISKAFMNTDELGELVTLNGVSVKIVQDNDRLSFKIKKDYDGLVIGDILFYISGPEYQKIPYVSVPARAGDALNYAGKACTITSVLDNAGIWEIILQSAGA